MSKRDRRLRRVQMFFESNALYFADSDQDSDPDMHEWENQQIRKGVTGAQVSRAKTIKSISVQFWFLFSIIHS